MITKTILAITVITGLGTIIFGGGVVIMKYYKTSNDQPNNKIWNSIYKCSEEHPEFCDKSCQVDSDCIPSCTHNMGCIRSGEGQVGAKAIRCEVAPFSCKCENNKCEIVEYEYKVKLLQSAKILGISLPIEIKKVVYYSDGETTGVTTQDASSKEFIFCFDGRMEVRKFDDDPEQYHIYIGATYPTRSNAQEIPIAGEKEKAILCILQDWANKQVSKEEQTRLLNIRTVDGLSEKELKIYRILKVIKRLENRNQTDNQPDTSDWQTYRNEEFGFEMKYPEDWTAISPNKINNLVNFGVRNGSGVAVVSVVILGEKNIQEEINKQKLEMKTIDKNALITESEVLINNIKTKQIKLLYQPLGSFPESLEISTYFNYGNNLYTIHLSAYKRTEQEAIDIYNSFLSTFKFIEK